jgi:hypothetical protein
LVFTNPYRSFILKNTKNLKLKAGSKLMPRPRKYDYTKDYPVKIALFVELPVEYANELENLYSHKELTKLVAPFLIEIVENNRKNKDVDSPIENKSEDI